MVLHTPACLRPDPEPQTERPPPPPPPPPLSHGPTCAVPSCCPADVSAMGAQGKAAAGSISG
jgi:hypothetical protein